MSSPAQRPLDDPAAGAGLLLIRLALVVLAFGVPVSAVLSRRASFTLLPVGTGLILVAATLLPRPRIKQRLRDSALSIVGLATIALLAWCAISLVWTPFPREAFVRLAKEVGTLLLVTCGIAVMPERTRTANLYLFPLGLGLAAAATFAAAVLGLRSVVIFQDVDPTLERAVVSLVLLVWPAIGALAVRERWASAGWLAVGVTLAAMAAWTSIALASLAAGALVFAMATINPSVVGRLLGGLTAAVILLGPAWPILVDPVAAGLADAVGDRLPALNDAAQSIHVWAELVLAQPVRLITGHGFDMATRATAFGFLPSAVPRSVLFEIWYELGVVGAVVAAVLAYCGFAAAGRSSPTIAPFLLAEIVTGLTVSVWGPDTTQSWWFTLLGVVALAFATVIRGQYRTSRPPVRLAAAVGGLRETEPSMN